MVQSVPGVQCSPVVLYSLVGPVTLEARFLRSFRSFRPVPVLLGVPVLLVVLGRRLFPQSRSNRSSQKDLDFPAVLLHLGVPHFPVGRWVPVSLGVLFHPKSQPNLKSRLFRSIRLFLQSQNYLKYLLFLKNRQFPVDPPHPAVRSRPGVP